MSHTAEGTTDVKNPFHAWSGFRLLQVHSPFGRFLIPVIPGPRETTDETLIRSDLQGEGSDTVSETYPIMFMRRPHTHVDLYSLTRTLP